MERRQSWRRESESRSRGSVAMKRRSGAEPEAVAAKRTAAEKVATDDPCVASQEVRAGPCWCGAWAGKRKKRATRNAVTTRAASSPPRERVRPMPVASVPQRRTAPATATMRFSRRSVEPLFRRVVRCDGGDEDEDGESGREGDLEPPREVVRVDEGAGEAARLRLRGDGPQDVEDGGDDERGVEGAPAGAEAEQDEGRDEERRAGQDEEDDVPRLGRGDGKARRERRGAAEGGSRFARFPVYFEGSGRDQPEQPVGKGNQLRQPEHRETPEKRRREPHRGVGQRRAA